MTEPRPIYEPAAQVHQRKLINRAATERNIDAALAWIKVLAQYANTTKRAAKKTDDDNALHAMAQEALGLNLALAALAAGIPLEAA